MHASALGPFYHDTYEIQICSEWDTEHTYRNYLTTSNSDYFPPNYNPRELARTAARESGPDALMIAIAIQTGSNWMNDYGVVDATKNNIKVSSKCTNSLLYRMLGL